MTTVNTNLQALHAQNALAVNERQLNKSMQELSTGLRVNSAADDAASMAIGTKMGARVASLQQALRNSNDGISMLQTADGAASTISTMLYRMNELAIQASNNTYGSTDLTALNSEFSDLKAQISNIVTNTTWNGRTLLNGSLGSLSIQVGINGASTDTVSASFSTNFSNLAVLSASGVSNATDSAAALTAVTSSISTVDTARSGWGATINRLNYAADSNANVAMNLSMSKSQLVDADYAKATADLAKAQILQAAGTAMLSQANQQPIMVLRLLS